MSSVIRSPNTQPLPSLCVIYSLLVFTVWLSLVWSDHLRHSHFFRCALYSCSSYVHCVAMSSVTRSPSTQPLPSLCLIFCSSSVHSVAMSSVIRSPSTQLLPSLCLICCLLMCTVLLSLVWPDHLVHSHFLRCALYFALLMCTVWLCLVWSDHLIHSHFLRCVFFTVFLLYVHCVAMYEVTRSPSTQPLPSLCLIYCLLTVCALCGYV